MVASFDWSATPLGPPHLWPRSFRTAASICLCSRYPIVVWWGPELRLLYNDAYLPILGNKHPALGRPGREVWSDIWHVVGPMLDRVMQEGEPTWSHDQQLPVQRSGYVEEAYFTFSYSPIFDEAGRVEGIFTPVTETTNRVVGERRLRTLRALAEETSDATTPKEACSKAAQALRPAAADLPFVLIYLLNGDRRQGVLAGSAGLEPGTVLAPVQVDVTRDGGPWPLAHAIAESQAQVVSRASVGPAWLAARGVEESGASTPDVAVVVPIMESGGERASAVLVAGVSPRRRLDEDYESFLQLLGRQLGTAITDAGAYEAERRRAEALAEIDRAKTIFFNNVSHEFRTPLTLVLGPLEDALSDPQPTPDAQRDRITLAHRGSLRLLRLVNTLLDFARLQAGRVQAAFEPVDLAASTADIASTFRSAIERGGLRLRVDAHSLPEAVLVDRDMWERVILNLISNAFKFTLAGEVAVTVRDAGACAEVTVADTGSGIPEEELPSLFTRFHRIPDTPARSQEGTGIGLSLVHELLRLQGAEITVTSKVQEGTTFTIRVPYGTDHLPAGWKRASTNAAPSAMGASPYVEEAIGWLHGEPGGSGDRADAELRGANDDQAEGATPAHPDAARVLVVDDNADLRTYLEHVLGTYWEVETTHDGLAALELMQARPFDLVVTDAMMPGLDGFGLLRALRSDTATRAVPVVMLSARAGEEAVVEGLEAGADDYLLKPFSAPELVARVRSTLELARLRKSVEASALRYQEMQRANLRSLELLHSVSSQVGAGVTMSEFLASLAGTVARLVGARRVGFFRVHPGGTRMTVQAAHGFTEPGLAALHDIPSDPGGADVGGRIVYHDYVLRQPPSVDDESAPLDAGDVEQARGGDAIGVAWRVGNERLGMAAAYDSRSEGGFTEEDTWVLRIAAEAAGLVVKHREEQTRALEAAVLLDQQLSELQRLHEVARTLSSTLDSAAIADAVVSAAAAIVAPDSSSPRAALLDVRKNRLTYLAATDSDLRGGGVAPDLTRSLLAVVADAPGPIPSSLGARVLGAAGDAADAAIESSALAPIRSDTELLGVLAIGAGEDGLFGEPELSRLDVIARLAALALLNARHFDAVRREAERRTALEKSKSDFLRVASHELGGPLAVLRGYIEMLSEGREVDTERVYSILSSRVARMSLLVRQMLEASRIDDERLSLNLADIDLRVPVRLAFESAGLLTKSRHGLELSEPEEPLVLRADAERIETIVTNLLDNAIKYSPEGGVVRCSVRAEPGKGIVEIVDDGLGIAREDLARLFTRFGRIVTSDNSHIPGTGLGLYISDELARLHGGEIRVESEPGSGSTFQLILPADRKS